MDTDKVCARCGERLSRGGKSRWAYRTGTVCFLGMAVLMMGFNPYPGSTKFSEVVASSMTVGLFCMVAGMAGMAVGWVLGALFSD
jgi:hypothetical protein